VIRGGRWTRHVPLGCVVLGASLALFFGWRLFWFLTDDAFIAFRYVSNEIAGRGLVWNPAPFRAVEGYTSFLWVALLDVTWRVTGVEPPDSANWLALLFGYGTLGLVVHALVRLELPDWVQHRRVGLVAFALVGILSNRTFLTWLSSGLETSLFNFLVSAWICTTMLGTRLAPQPRLWLSSSTAAALALTRPDGLLFCAVSAGLAARAACEQRSLRGAAALAPFLVVAAHLVWRFGTYGALLPNTYYAKHVGSWPESGVRYAASFIVEYGLYVPLLLLVVGVWRRRIGRPVSVAFALGAIALVGHLAYYTFVIGGDHFEYRVYSHLVPWVWVATIWLVPRVLDGARASLAVLGASLALSLPIPWLHWARTHEKTTRASTVFMIEPIAPVFPPPFRALVEPWDDWQAWLIHRYVCRRHQEHKIYVDVQRAFYPARAEGRSAVGRDWPTLAVGGVGVPGWTLPNVAIIDIHGLNDLVVARTPPDRRRPRKMAHDRWAPPGYLSCLQPNVVIQARRAIIHERPLSEAAIVACEKRFLPAAALD
jgi:arabinofuranosyltransferase